MLTVGELKFAIGDLPDGAPVKLWIANNITFGFNDQMGFEAVGANPSVSTRRKSLSIHISMPKAVIVQKA